MHGLRTFQLNAAAVTLDRGRRKVNSAQEDKHKMYRFKK